MSLSAPDAMLVSLLERSGYDETTLRRDYRVWLGERESATVPLVAFGSAVRQDMTTAVLVAGSYSRMGVETLLAAGQRLAAPALVIARADGVQLWDPHRQNVVDEFSPDDVLRDLPPLLEARALLAAKVGNRQLPLFPEPVNLLVSARRRSADGLTPLVTEALRASSVHYQEQALNGRSGKEAARLVVGALTVLSLWDKQDRNADPRPGSGVLMDVAIQRYPRQFAWLRSLGRAEAEWFAELLTLLGDGIDYESLDPSVLSEVYEDALVDEDKRKELGIHYTPARLARRILEELPVETIAPESRTVLDPTCGSGGLLVAAHDRLGALQPEDWSLDQRHQDLALHVRGMDVDPLAVEIAQLALQLAAVPAGNGWKVEQRNALGSRMQDGERPSIIVANPPWRYRSAAGSRAQSADQFILWMLDALAAGGLLAVVMPYASTTTKTSAAMRERLTTECEVFEVWHLPEGTFPTSAVAPAVVFARKLSVGESHQGFRLIRRVDRASLPGFSDGGVASESWLCPTAGSSKESLLGPGVLSTFMATQRWARLKEIADVRSGPQPRAGVSHRRSGHPWLMGARAAKAYGTIQPSAITYRSYPEDFEGAWAADLIGRKKLLVPAARASSNPWRMRVFLDLLGVGADHGFRMVVPKDDDDDDMLFALLVLLGSGLACRLIDECARDRNIPVDALNDFPLPRRSAAWAQLAQLGRQIVAATDSDDPSALAELLREAESLVWKLYGVPPGVREQVAQRFVGVAGPEGSLRYPAQKAREVAAVVPPYPLRRYGCVLAVSVSGVRLWVPGLTPDEGTDLSIPPRMPGWLFREGATFDVHLQPGGLEAGEYRLQAHSYSNPLEDEVAALQ